MIGWLKGTVVVKGDSESVIEAGGVGYAVIHSATTAASIPGEGSVATLHIFTNVRENEIALFGFASRSEKELFLKLISVSDIGPRKALAILSGTGPSEIVRAVRDANVTLLMSIPGIGKKTAERLIVELKDKLKGFENAPEEKGGIAGGSGLRNELMSVLANLGYRALQADRVIDRMRERFDGSVSLDTLIREALSELKKG